MEDIKEKTADEMFEELGYSKIYDNEDILELYDKKNFNKKIVFYKNWKEVAKLYTFEISMQELQAINKKCKELNWLGDE